MTFDDNFVRNVSDSISLILYSCCLGLSPVISARIHSKCAWYSEKFTKSRYSCPRCPPACCRDKPQHHERDAVQDHICVAGDQLIDGPDLRACCHPPPWPTQTSRLTDSETVWWRPRSQTLWLVTQGWLKMTDMKLEDKIYIVWK